MPYLLCIVLFLSCLELHAQRPIVVFLPWQETYRTTVSTHELPEILPQRATGYQEDGRLIMEPVEGVKITLRRMRDVHYRPVADSAGVYNYTQLTGLKTFLLSGYYQLSMAHPDYVTQTRWMYLARIEIGGQYYCYSSLLFNYEYSAYPRGSAYKPLLYKAGEAVLYEGAQGIFPLYLYPQYCASLVARQQTTGAVSLDTLVARIQTWKAHWKLDTIQAGRFCTYTLPTASLDAATRAQLLDTLSKHPHLKVGDIKVRYTPLPASRRRNPHCQGFAAYQALERTVDIELFPFVYQDSSLTKELESLLAALSFQLPQALFYHAIHHGTVPIKASYRAYYMGSMAPETLNHVLLALYNSGFVSSVRFQQDVHRLF